ncbi:MAG: hypothetical protein ABIT05_09490 [Chitinophagaceae bacterium]
MKNWLILWLIAVILLPCCRHKEKEPDKKFISVLSLIRKQVAHIDTSLYSIVKVVSTDSLHHDTTYIPREQFAAVAKEFLEIPDLSDSKVAKRYKEEPAIYDEMLNRVIITYLPIDPAREEFKRQELLATPVPGDDSKINNIIIIREISNRDSFLQKNMLWQMDKYFQVVTRSQKPGQPEITTITRVTWNEDTYQ